MAGAEGFEPPLAVLETAVLPLKLRPLADTPSHGEPERTFSASHHEGRNATPATSSRGAVDASGNEGRIY